MNEYREYSKDIWNYLDDMPYMPSRVDRDKLISSDRAQIWDYFFRIKPDDVGKPQKEEITEIEISIAKEISKYTQRQNEISESIKRNKRELFRKRLRNFFYGAACFILAVLVSIYISNNSSSLDWQLFCVSPFFFGGLILWLAIIVVGWGEKREIRGLKAQSDVLRELHNESIRTKIDRKKFLKAEIKDLKRQIPRPPSSTEVSQWLVKHLDGALDDSKRATGLLDGDLIKIDAPNPILFSGPGELQNPKRFPPTFTKIRASDDENFDIKKHLTARRAFENFDRSIDVLYGVYYLECILIAKDMLATYGLFYDFITGKSHAIEITEQYYNDVVSIVITNEFRWIRKSEAEIGESKELYIEDAPTFTMSLASGENRKVTFVSEKYFLKIKDEIDVPEENISKIFLIQNSQASASNAIRALRQQLRLHKTIDNIDE